MCGRYHFGADALDEIAEIVEQADWKLELGLLDRDIHPGDMAPVLVQGMEKNGKGADVLQVRWQRWGFTAPGGKGLVFNARSESVFEKRMFRDSVDKRRAAVPVSWFYEWNKSKEKFTFTREDSHVLFLAGCYSLYEDGEHFVILTTEANRSMIPVHSRMPLVLEKEQVKDWILNREMTEELLGQIPGELEKSCEYEQQTLF